MKSLHAKLVLAFVPLPIISFCLLLAANDVRSKQPPTPFLLKSSISAPTATLQARHYVKIVNLYCFLRAMMTQAACFEEDCNKQPRVGKGQVRQGRK